ncbi:MAG: ExbD/TolR family protein [Polyangiales bacterium]
MDERDERLTVAQKSKIRRAIAALTREKGEEPSAEAGELNVVPFLDIISNVMMFVLASLTVAFTTTLDVDPPKKPHGTPGESLSLTVIIATDGYVLKDREHTIGTVPRIAGEASVDGKVYDAASLARRAHELKKSAPENKQIILTANPNVPMQEIVRAMDAVKDDYPDVLLAVVR